MKRIEYIDYLETIAIFFVVFLHRNTLGNGIVGNLLMVIGSVAVPLFFMVNGYLLMSKPFCMKKHLKKIVRLYLSLMAWRFIYLALSILVNFVLLEDISIKDFVLYILGASIKEIPASHMWYMYALLAIYVLVPLFKTCYDTNVKVYYFTTAFLGIIVFGTEEINTMMSYVFDENTFQITVVNNLLNPFFNKGNCLFFFLIGAPVVKYVSRIESRMKSYLIDICSIISIVCGGTWLFFAKYMQCGTIRWTGESFRNGYYKLGTVLLAVGMMIWFMRRRYPFKNVNRIVSFVSRHTMDIYYIHMFLAAFYMEYLFKYGGDCPKTDSVGG